MEAIGELISAVLEGLAHSVGELLAGVFEFFALLIETCLYGVSESRHRSEARAEKRRAHQNVGKSSEEASQIERYGDTNLDPTQPSVATLEPPVPQSPPLTNQQRWQQAIAVFVILAGIALVALVLGWTWDDSRQRRKTTELALKNVADGIVDRFKQDRTAVPSSGKLQENDGWNNPLELFVDDFDVGYLFVIRSMGPDGTSGTADDLLEMRTARADAKAAAGDLFERGLKAFKKKFGKKPNAD